MSPDLAPNAINGSSTAPPKNYYSHPREEMLPFFPAGARRILDVGCGRGGFGALLKSHLAGVEVWGVEPAQEACAEASAVLDRACLGLFDTSLQLPSDYFDVVVFNDSLEHFPDERVALKLAVSLLRKGGCVVASIPNVRSWIQVNQFILDADWKYESEGVMDRTHLRFFTRKSVERTFVETGYRVEKIVGINPGWTGVKFSLLKRFFPRIMADMEFNQFAVVAKPV